MGCTSAQLALAWLLARGDHVLPIPGTTNLAHLEEDLAASDLVLSDDAVTRLDALIHAGNVNGARYGVQSQTEVDTEEF